MWYVALPHFRRAPEAESERCKGQGGTQAAEELFWAEKSIYRMYLNYILNTLYAKQFYYDKAIVPLEGKQ